MTIQANASAVRRGAALLLLSALAATACGGAGAQPPVVASASPSPPVFDGIGDPDVAATVTTVVGSAHHPEMKWPDIPDVAPTLKDLYAAEPDGLFWFDGTTPNPRLGALVKGLALADEHGLERADYDADRLAERWSVLRSGAEIAPAQRALFDLALSACLSRLITAVHVGRVDPATLRWGYDIAPKRPDRAAALRELRDTGDLEHALALREPPFTHYARARRVLARYQAASAHEPPAVQALGKDRKKVEPGQPWEGVGALAARLRVFGDLTGDAPADVYDGALVDAVKRFQRRHGLDADGVIGAGTVAAVNVTIAHRVRQIELAMERMRWLPALSDRPNLFVNVALFRMWATDPRSTSEPLRMNVVVGKSLDHKTPIFIDRMEYVVFRPYWNPPYGITVKEIIPHAKRDPAYFARENLEIVASGDDDAPALPPTPENLAHVLSGRLSIRQKPGPRNSLGLAKFIFPNSDNIYMHGTPAQSLFSRTRRDFSHGCIRLEDPAKLAEWVLRDQPEWTREKIDAAMQGTRPTRVNLKEPVTVVLFYDTVHVNSEGTLFFVDDIYGHDRQLDAALRQGYPYPTKD
ncbi:MAG TPA: L,D-transpeptidase family protein [Vicinamibacteria bacterium]|nr:L,D-transpeptidase family protein [Vicinamibacteria bacterium]